MSKIYGMKLDEQEDMRFEYSCTVKIEPPRVEKRYGFGERVVAEERWGSDSINSLQIVLKARYPNVDEFVIQHRIDYDSNESRYDFLKVYKPRRNATN